jgi:predicted DCC family thiol-disulfide oxidoreductase YuxK
VICDQPAVVPHSYAGQLSLPPVAIVPLVRDVLREHDPMTSTCRTVYFDKSCALCAAEIHHYERLSPAGAVRFVDVSNVAAALGPDLTQSAAMTRFHVRDDAGVLHSGAAAFIQLWAVLPGWRHAAKIAALPGAVWTLERLYRAFLPARPALAWAVRLMGQIKGRTAS